MKSEARARPFSEAEIDFVEFLAELVSLILEQERQDELVENPNHPINNFFEEADDRGPITGACGFCANSFDATDGCEEAAVEILGGPDEHAPKPSELVDDEHELLTIG